MLKSIDMRGRAEEILDRNLSGYPWIHWSKENALNSMVEFAKEYHEEMTAGVEIGFPTQEEIDLENTSSTEHKETI